MYIIIIYGNCILHNQINAYFVNVTQKMFGFGLNFSNFLNYLSCSCLSFYTRPNFHHLCKQPQKWLGFSSPSFYISTYLRASIFSVLSSSHNLYFKFNVWRKSLGSSNTNIEQMLPSSDASTPPEYQNGINFQFGNFMTLRRGPMGGGARVI